MRRLIWSILLLGMFLSCGVAAYYRQQALEFRGNLAVFENLKKQSRESRPATNMIPATMKTDSGRSNQLFMAVEMESRIHELEAALQNKDVLIASLQQAATNRLANLPRSSSRLQAWLDDLKQNNPRQYAAVTQRWEQARLAAQTSFAEKEAYLQARDQDAMSEDEQGAYQQMTQLLNETWRLADLLQTGADPAERRLAMQTLRQNMRQLAPMLLAERSKEWYNLGLQLGYKDADALAFSEYLNKVIDLTDMQSIYRNMRSGTYMPQNPATSSASAPGR